eukprot:TRINITY_DN101798_c0_g1_i1.p1 TRINITY_DN101798_c0_g1~~TRINITY_DN101798_c0_g1_i1.p1  ORF type:complete len:414 (+),score=92.25 TRINITY_DN101798_c0_g1_i1:114-1355(+)
MGMDMKRNGHTIAADPHHRSRSPKKVQVQTAEADDDDDEDEEEREQRRQRDRKAPHFEWSAGLALGPESRYVIEDLVGEGTFGRAFRCVDQRSKPTKVAVKVIKGVKRYCEDAEIEVDILEEIQKRDKHGKCCCVKLLGHFRHPANEGASWPHLCIVLEPLDMNLRDVLKKNHSRGLLMKDVRKIVRQLLECLAFLHSIDLIHCDLKCRNIMLRNATADWRPLPRHARQVDVLSPQDCTIAVIDFGGACFKDDSHDGRIGTRQYRAPEVLLGLAWDEKSDLWSAGCIAAMLYTGHRPFQVHESQEHLALMEKVTGRPVPPAMVRRARRRAQGGSLPEDVQFDEQQKLVWPEGADEEAIENVDETKPLSAVTASQHIDFLTLLIGLLEIDPAQRLSAAAALDLALFKKAEPPPE